MAAAAGRQVKVSDLAAGAVVKFTRHSAVARTRSYEDYASFESTLQAPHSAGATILPRTPHTHTITAPIRILTQPPLLYSHGLFSVA